MVDGARDRASLLELLVGRARIDKQRLLCASANACSGVSRAKRARAAASSASIVQLLTGA